MERENRSTDWQTEAGRPEKTEKEPINAAADTATDAADTAPGAVSDIGQIRIRDGCAADDPAIEKILGVYFLDRDDIPAERFVLAAYGERIVGAASYDICEKAADERSTGEREKFGEIHTIAVLPSFKNKGIGKKLLEALIGRLVRQRDGEHLSETIYVRTTAPGFFKHMGFEDCPPDLKKELWDECRSCETYAACAQKTLMIARDEKKRRLG